MNDKDYDFTDLKVGDKVLEQTGRFSKSYFLGEVVKVTPTQIVAEIDFGWRKDTVRFYKFNTPEWYGRSRGGRCIGDSDEARLMHYDDAIWKKQYELRLRGNVTNTLRKLDTDKLSVETLEKIMALIEGKTKARE